MPKPVFLKPEDREEQVQKRKAQAERFLAAHRNKPTTSADRKPNIKVEEVAHPASSAPIVIKEHPSKPQYGAAQVPVYRYDENVACTPSPSLVQLVNLYLEVAHSRSRRIAMVWPASPQSLVALHSLATLERWRVGDKLGIRGLIFPAKSNVFHLLNHLRLDRKQILSLTRELIEDSSNDNRSAIRRGMTEKDPFLMSLASLKAEGAEQFNPSIGELLPSFYAGSGFRAWRPCSQQLLSNISARLKRRSHGQALNRHCDEIGNPKRAPDALFAIDGRLTKDEQRKVLEALKAVGRPEVVLVNATRSVRKNAASWLKHIARFLKLLEEVFTPEGLPGVLVVTDEPHAAYQLQAELNKSTRQGGNNGSKFAISGILGSVGGDSLLPAGVESIEPVSPREFDVALVDSEAKRVINKLYRISRSLQQRNVDAGPVEEAAAYMSRLAALPCGVDTLVEWLSDARVSDQARRIYSWSHFHAAVSQFIQQGNCRDDQVELRECLDIGSKLYANYKNATPFAMRLAKLVGDSAEAKKRRIAIVFTRKVSQHLAQKFLEQYSEFPDGAHFGDFSDRVQFVLSGQLEERLPQLHGAQLVFAGLDEEGLRLLMTSNKIEKHTQILLTCRAGQYLKGTLRPLVERFEEFKPLKPRMESILRQLSTLNDDNSILSIGDFVPPTFRHELSVDMNEAGDPSDPEACAINLEGGAHLYRRPTQLVYVYDPASEWATEGGFRACEVKSLGPGDKLFQMSADLREMVESVLKDAGVPIEHDKSFEAALRGYHRIVSKKFDERFPAKSVAEQVRLMRTHILQAHPELAKEFPGAQAVRHWVDVDSVADKPFDQVQTQAPMHEAHFAVFAEALGIAGLEAAFYWQSVIMAVRTARRIDGRHVSDLYAHMLLQPESAMLNANISAATIKKLFSKARDNVVIIESIALPKGSTEDE
jgi:hypothetical protein